MASSTGPSRHARVAPTHGHHVDLPKSSHRLIVQKVLTGPVREAWLARCSCGWQTSVGSEGGGQAAAERLSSSHRPGDPIIFLSGNRRARCTCGWRSPLCGDEEGAEYLADSHWCENHDPLFPPKPPGTPSGSGGTSRRPTGRPAGEHVCIVCGYIRHGDLFLIGGDVCVDCRA